MKNQSRKNLIDAINHTLDLIDGIENILENLRKEGEKEDSLMIRQYKHLKMKYSKTLKEQLQKLKLPLQIKLLENENF